MASYGENALERDSEDEIEIDVELTQGNHGAAGRISIANGPILHAKSHFLKLEEIATKKAARQLVIDTNNLKAIQRAAAESEIVYTFRRLNIILPPPPRLRYQSCDNVRHMYR